MGKERIETENERFVVGYRAVLEGGVWTCELTGLVWPSDDGTEVMTVGWGHAPTGSGPTKIAALESLVSTVFDEFKAVAVIGETSEG